MKARNLPPALMNLSLLAGVGSAVLAGGLALFLVLVIILGTKSEALAVVVASIPLWYPVAVGIAISLASIDALTASTASLFGKRDDGTIPWHRWLPLWPFHLAAWVVMWGNRALASEDHVSKIENGWYLGGCPYRPSDLPAGPPPALLDVTCLRPEQVEEGVQWALGQRNQGRPVYTYCTHGHARSAVMVCAILIADGLAVNPEEAGKKVAERRPGIRPNKRQWEALTAWYQKYGHAGRA